MASKGRCFRQQRATRRRKAVQAAAIAALRAQGAFFRTRFGGRVDVSWWDLPLVAKQVLVEKFKAGMV